MDRWTYLSRCVEDIRVLVIEWQDHARGLVDGDRGQRSSAAPPGVPILELALGLAREAEAHEFLLRSQEGELHTLCSLVGVRD